MARKNSDATSFRGRWRLMDTDLWDLDDLDLVEPAHITFGSRGLGSFAFIAVQAELDYVVGQRDGQPVVEFTWEGVDEGDPICGRGWARLDGESLVGEIYFHRGDHSGFVARREDG